MTLPADIIVSAQGLSRSFGDIAAVRNVDLAIGKGEIFGLVGPDGAGKTTTMRMLAGVLSPDAGQIFLDGIDVVRAPEHAKPHISYMPQRFGLYEDLTVLENIFFYAELFGIPASVRRTRSAELLSAAAMAPFSKRLAGRLSGGMKQKLGLVCALIHAPDVLLLDEPTTGVDPVSRREFWEILYRLRESGVTIVFSTAYMDEAERCSRLALMNAGEIRHCDTPDRLKRAMPGALLSVTAVDVRGAFDALKGVPGVLGKLMMGDRVNVRVDDARRREPELREALARQAIAAEVGSIEPSIEDVFVALLGKGQAT
ncbi:ABC transporter ATP-binding protein [Rhizobium sp. BK376]|uniref:ABC transporter ATP-binding protein n=1 Tax=Rhizobium sp. BK376 TaxID=2512149 RepID=UPI0010433E25|nr:ABC transporter ATP-binding protein [Rhizobium sp. BK376]TCR75625.1 ABC-2 type transport system ATP-binding protein [Rhizobium sp. BK376]